MIKSMTGYGKSTLNVNSREYQVEIRTVNHKYTDISIKMPKIMSYLEDNIRKEISSQIKRGKIDISISFENYAQETNNVRINTELAKLYIKELRKLAEEENISANIDVTEISKFPDVLKIKCDFDENLIKEEISEVLRDALNQVIKMRENEGTQIAEDILTKISQIESKTEEIFDL